LTGARLGEVLTSRKEDFDLQRGVWTKPSHQTKQKRTEHLPLSAQALALTASIIQTSDPVSPFLFPGNKPGQPLREIKKFWSTAMRQDGIINYRQHDNRHTYASHLVSSGLSLEIVGRLLGHTTATTTKRYAHLADHRCVRPRTGSAQRLRPSRTDANPMPFLFTPKPDQSLTDSLRYSDILSQAGRWRPSSSNGFDNCPRYFIIGSSAIQIKPLQPLFAIKGTFNISRIP
jgi:hypothetical protein